MRVQLLHMGCKQRACAAARLNAQRGALQFGRKLGAVNAAAGCVAAILRWIVCDGGRPVRRAIHRERNADGQVLANIWAAVARYNKMRLSRNR